MREMRERERETFMRETFITELGEDFLIFDWWWALFDHRAAENGG